LIIPEEPRPAPRRFTIVHANLQVGPIEMGANERVTTGTPIRPGPRGWAVGRDGQDIWAYVGSPPSGSNATVDAWREIVAEVGTTAYPPGARLKVAYVNDDGVASLVPDARGHIATLGRTRLILLPNGPINIIPTFIAEEPETANARS